MTSLKDIKKMADMAKDSKRGGEEDIMLNAEYLRKSSNLISDALQEGFDVLQLENGDVITTGTKTVVTHYRWDADKEKMVKVTAKERKDAEKRRKDLQKKVLKAEKSGKKSASKK